MFGILISALNTLLGFVFRSLIIKFVVFFALYFVVQGFVEILVELLPDSSNLSSLFSFNYKGMLMSGIIDGERVTLYTGKK
ncbi:DUF2523 domain-containing protein [Salmonella enterica]|nr:DUF2523 domain-containing protein [Salmonella enterica]EHF5538071.1 DUF2523 domain-containing protein [Salmonella enterica]